MRAFFTLTAIFIFSVGYAQSNLPVKSSSQITSFKGQLIQDPGIIPDCGISFTKITLKFRVIESNCFDNKINIREVLIEAPNESFGRDFFKKDRIYYISATSIKTIDWINLFNENKSNLEVVNQQGWKCERISKAL